MKIAYFIGALNRGGAETLILDICRQQGKVPFDFVCIYRHDGNMSDDFKASGAPLIQIPKNGGLLNYIQQVRRVLLREKITIVHSQTPSNTLILAAALIGTGIKIITTFHGHLFADAPWWQRKIVYAASEKIICVSEYQKHYYEQKWGLPLKNKLKVVYNGIDFSKLDSEKSIVNSEELIVNSGIRLCMVGNFIKGRSQYVICRAIDLLKQKGLIDFDFYFIGRKDNTEPERYDECVHFCVERGLDNVHFLGAREDVPALLKTMDGFVYSTEHDTFGIAVIEAIASGIPVIVNDWDVMMEVSNQGEWATIYQTGNVKQLADVMDKLITRSDEYKKIAKEYSVQVRQKYSIENHIHNLYTIYHAI